MAETEKGLPFGAPSLYLPQRPPMLVLDRVESITEDSARCSAEAGASGPLEIFADEAGRLPLTLFIELMAQTAGVWAGYWRRQENERLPEQQRDAPLGLLLSVRGLEVRAAEIPRRGRLEVKMSKLFYEGPLGSFEGSVLCGGRLLACGRVSVCQPRNFELTEKLDKAA